MVRVEKLKTNLKTKEKSRVTRRSQKPKRFCKTKPCKKQNLYEESKQRLLASGGIGLIITTKLKKIKIESVVKTTCFRQTICIHTIHLFVDKYKGTN